jgi:molybdenum cofactor cytidylyltransferase
MRRSAGFGGRGEGGDAPEESVGILLAAGAGTRFGGAKALALGADGEPWLTRGVAALLAGGCGRVVVVLGAEAARARALLGVQAGDADGPAAPAPAASHLGKTAVLVVEATAWADGVSASLRAGLEAAVDLGASVAVVSLVDLPGLRRDAVSRMLDGASAATLRQAVYDGRPGHPVVIGSQHFAALTASVGGDVGARPYLVAHEAGLIDCSDLGGGDDIDEAGDLRSPAATPAADSGRGSGAG